MDDCQKLIQENVKRAKNAVTAVFLVFLMSIMTYSLFWGPVKKISDSFYPARTITVLAEGKATVSPDIAKISFSVVSEGVDPGKIADENNKKMTRALDFVKSQGIDEKDIKTTQYNLNPRYVYDEKNRRSYISGYELTQTVLIKVRELNKSGKILGGLPELGINKIGSISFDVDDSEKYLAEARNRAFEKAKAKADAMAKKNGVRIGRVVNFAENQGYPVFPAYESFGRDIKAAALAVPSIEPGTQEVVVNVNITYEIR